GLHILSPIRPELPYPHVRRFAKALSEEVERRVGDQRVATTTWRVADREGVFVDFGQNARDRTLASPPRSTGTRCRTSTRQPSRSRRCGRGSPRPETRCAPCGAVPHRCDTVSSASASSRHLQTPNTWID